MLSNATLTGYSNLACPGWRSCSGIFLLDVGMAATCGSQVGVEAKLVEVRAVPEPVPHTRVPKSMGVKVCQDGSRPSGDPRVYKSREKVLLPGAASVPEYSRTQA